MSRRYTGLYLFGRPIFEDDDMPTGEIILESRVERYPLSVSVEQEQIKFRMHNKRQPKTAIVCEIVDEGGNFIRTERGIPTHEDRCYECDECLGCTPTQGGCVDNANHYWRKVGE